MEAKQKPPKAKKSASQIEISNCQPGKLLGENENPATKNMQKRGSVQLTKQEIRTVTRRTRINSKTMSRISDSSVPENEELYLELKNSKKKTRKSKNSSSSVYSPYAHTTSKAEKSDSVRESPNHNKKNSNTTLRVPETDFIRHTSRTSMITLSPRISKIYKLSDSKLEPVMSCDDVQHYVEVDLQEENFKQKPTPAQDAIKQRFSLNSMITGPDTLLLN
ncbi:hypothetical protein BB561_004527 [Smittium simulii]|uniref:Uncharacterized protein n=1 Tax=Smittium simulii TaxID=133385 RepID=A0A2T9YFS4_9FUNG|nr:hypothetical protein BB561_004527 [Smittium simulii]